MIAPPPLSSMWEQYPLGLPEEIKQLVGGRVDAAWVNNVCAVRLSRAFNYCGIRAHRIRGRFGLSVVSGSDGLWYGYRAREMRVYLESMYGDPTIHTRSQSEMSGTPGIVVFRGDYGDAVGHADLWDGTTLRYYSPIESLFDRNGEVYLWKA